MSQKNNKGESAESCETPQKINYPVLSLVLLMWALILGMPLYYGWQLFIYDRSHQVPLVCTVESAEHKSSTSSGVRYSSSEDDIVFSTVECEGLYMPVSEGEIESTLSRVEPGKKYEFMLGETGVDSWGQREVFSFSGPVE